MLDDDGNEGKARLNKPEFLISFKVFYLSTTFTTHPVGILTINELSLLNLSNFLAELNLKDSSLLLKFKLNGNKLSS